MEREASIKRGAPSEAETDGKPSGSQTLLRGLDVIEAVANGPIALTELAETLGLTRSTTHRLAAALVDRRMLTFRPREGYAWAQASGTGLRRPPADAPAAVARPFLEQLSNATSDTVHLGVLEGDRASFLSRQGAGPPAG
jgi:DNA-binding IclR family transcriptional regulator